MHIFLETCRLWMYQDEHVLFFELYDARGANIATHIYIYICLFLWFYCALYTFLYDVLSITQMSI